MEKFVQQHPIHQYKCVYLTARYWFRCRYYAICSPLQARHIHTNKRAYIMLTSFWIASLLLISPQLFIQRLEPFLVLNVGDRENIVSIAYKCLEHFPEPWMSVLYSVMFYVILYLGPVLIMCVTYGKIAYTLWFRTPIDDLLSNQDASRRIEESVESFACLLSLLLFLPFAGFPFSRFKYFYFSIPILPHGKYHSESPWLSSSFVVTATVASIQ